MEQFSVATLQKAFDLVASIGGLTSKAEGGAREFGEDAAVAKPYLDQLHNEYDRASAEVPKTKDNRRLLITQAAMGRWVTGIVVAITKRLAYLENMARSENEGRHEAIRSLENRLESAMRRGDVTRDSFGDRISYLERLAAEKLFGDQISGVDKPAMTSGYVHIGGQLGAEPGSVVDPTWTAGVDMGQDTDTTHIVAHGEALRAAGKHVVLKLAGRGKRKTKKKAARRAPSRKAAATKAPKKTARKGKKK